MCGCDLRPNSQTKSWEMADMVKGGGPVGLEVPPCLPACLTAWLTGWVPGPTDRGPYMGWGGQQIGLASEESMRRGAQATRGLGVVWWSVVWGLEETRVPLN